MHIVNWTIHSRLAMVLIVIGVSVCVGCGGTDLSTVQGTVTFDGEPLEDGSITFEPAEGAGASAGGTIKNGQYQVDIPPGEKIVRIKSTRETGKKIELGPDDGAPPGTMVDEVEMYIPAVYNQDSTLRVEVSGGQVTHDFELMSQDEG